MALQPVETNGPLTLPSEFSPTLGVSRSDVGRLVLHGPKADDLPAVTLLKYWCPLLRHAGDPDH
jgi:hypothetical protein